MTVGIEQAPMGCNPHTEAGDSWATRMVLGPVLPSAFFPGPSGAADLDQSVVEQAEVVSLSPETIVYTINPKAVWSDGVPITASDFIYAWQEQRGMASGGSQDESSSSTLGYRDIASVRGSNSGHTVTVVFKTPYADWKGLFSDLLPSHVLERLGWSPDCSTVSPAVDLSGGPFMIASASPQAVVLVRNPHWWGSPVTLDRLVVRMASGPGQLSQWLGRGQVQVVAPTWFDQAFLEAVASFGQTQSSLQLGTAFVDLQLATRGQVTSSRQVRRALASAIDREALVHATVAWADKSIAPAASHVFAQGEGNYPDTPAGQRQAFPGTSHLGTTARLLEAAGYHRSPHGLWHSASGRPVVLRLVVDQGDPWAHQAGLLVAHQLHLAGFEIRSTEAPSAEAAGLDLASERADLAVVPRQTSPYPSQAIAWYTLSLGPPGVDGSEDWSRLDDPVVTQQLEAGASALTPAAAHAAYQRADVQLWRDMADLPLFTEPSVLAWSTRTFMVSPDPYPGGLLRSPQGWGLLVPRSERAPRSPGQAAS